MGSPVRARALWQFLVYVYHIMKPHHHTEKLRLCVFWLCLGLAMGSLCLGTTAATPFFDPPAITWQEARHKQTRVGEQCSTYGRRTSASQCMAIMKANSAPSVCHRGHKEAMCFCGPVH